MKYDKDLTQRLFVMHLQRDIEFTLRVGAAPSMKHSVMAAKEETLLTMDCLKELDAEAGLKSEAGGEA